MKESNLMKTIQIEASKMGARLLRNNVGKGWIGKSIAVKHPNQHIELLPGDVVVKNARRFHAGLCKGSSDLIGWTPVTITKDMVGQQLAVFTAVEVKAGSRATDDQLQFGRAVERAGGKFLIARSVQAVRQLLSRTDDRS